MIEQEFIMLIMNCKKYIKKANYQKQTWLKNLPSYIKYYHVIGDNNIESEYKFDEESQILYVKTDDDLHHIKQLMKHLHSNIFSKRMMTRY